MTTRFKYWFVHDDRSGYIYESDRFGLVIVFAGFLKIGEPFHIHNSEGENVTGDEKASLVEMLIVVISESIPRDEESRADGKG